MCKPLELIEQLKQSIQEIADYKTLLNNQLSTVDKKVSDILHYIELSENLNSVQGYNAYKLLREVTRERREIKNKIDEMNYLNQYMVQKSLAELTTLDKVSANVTKAHAKNISEDNTKRYEVRVLTELFGETIKKKHKTA